jgi:integrase
MNIKTTAGQARLTPRNDPHWLSLDKRIAIGFRKPVTVEKGGQCSWVARWRQQGKGGKKHYHALGTVIELPTFTLAKRAAEAWFGQMDSGASRAPSRGTVRDALADYLRDKREHGFKDSALDSGNRFRLTVPRKSQFGTMKLEDVTREDVTRWRQGLTAARSNRSVNRQVRQVVAGLNFAVDHAGHIGNKKAWKLKQLMESKAKKPRAYVVDGKQLKDEGAKARVYLTKEQRARLIAAAPPALAALLTGYMHTGSRPSELAAATVADFDAAGGSVTLRHHKGRGAEVKERAVWLSDAGIEFFKQQAKGKLPKAPLISNDAGKHFTDQQWCGGIQSAVKAAGAMPAGTTAYAFRHSRASDLLQEFGFDPLSVALQLGTSVGMVEKHYFHLISTSFREKLNAVKAAATEVKSA